ncbi:MAG: response regulator [Jatrophihabitans sp.]|uniref:response regulator n=1 Tax=Jatrophihabitans sp. TaxID=1932789 RepID=UPI00390F12A6
MTIRVVIADDQQLVRAGFRRILDAEKGIAVVAEAADGLEAIEAVHRHDPDLVVMDIRMPKLDGIAATRQLLREERRRTRVLILTTFDLDEYVYQALSAGASGFLLKDAPPEQLVTAARVVAAGDALLAPSVTRRLVEDFAQRPPPGQHPPAAVNSLTAREREVLLLLAQGLSNARIAAHLVVSEATAKTHVSHVLDKLQLTDRVQAVIFAYESGLVRPRARD